MNADADAENLDAKIAAEYRALAARFHALAAMRREEAEKADTPSRKHELLDGADTWERSALHLDAKARVYASFALRPVRSA